MLFLVLTVVLVFKAPSPFPHGADAVSQLEQRLTHFRSSGFRCVQLSNMLSNMLFDRLFSRQVLSAPLLSKTFVAASEHHSRVIVSCNLTDAIAAFSLPVMSRAMPDCGGWAARCTSWNGRGACGMPCSTGGTASRTCRCGLRRQACVPPSFWIDTTSYWIAQNRTGCRLLSPAEQ